MTTRQQAQEIRRQQLLRQQFAVRSLLDPHLSSARFGPSITPRGEAALKSEQIRKGAKI